jgi:glucose-6-phosphate 1-dehydrogenase
LKAISPLDKRNLCRGQFRGYRSEKVVAQDSKVETLAALRLKINSWRWQEVPFYIRAWKCLPVTGTEVVKRLRISPDVVIAMGTMGARCRIKDGRPIDGMVASLHPSTDETDAYERLLGDAMAGVASQFAREGYVEQARRIVDPVLKTETAIYEYKPGTWGPDDLDLRVLPADRWHDPVITLQPVLGGVIQGV